MLSMALRVPSGPLKSIKLLARTFNHSYPGRRTISTYGYTQAKSLIYPQCGAIPDVLEYVRYLF